MPVLRFILFFLPLTLFFMGCGNDHASDPTPSLDDCVVSKTSSTGTVIEGHYIVAFRDNSAGRTSASARVLAAHRIDAARVIDRIDGALTSYVMKLSASEADGLKKDPAIAAVEPDRIISVCACFTVVEPRLVTWNVSKVGYGDGTGKTAWVLDSGIDFDHPDLNVDRPRSRSFVSGVSTAMDDNGHGTHVAGIIGAKNNDIGTLGVASGATLVALKILDKDGNGLLSSALKALAYIRTNGKAGEAVNISLALNEVSDILDQELQSLGNLGFYIAVAAGNEGKPADEFSPARTSGKNIYTVSAIDSLDRFASFSNYGNDVVDYAAPGVRVPSTYKDGKYAIISGTSMASPHVAALLLINNGKINTKGYVISDPDGHPDAIAHR